VHPGRLVINPTKLDHVKNAARFVLRKLDGRYTPDPWLKMDPKVRLLCVPSLSERFVPDGDVVIATAWQTAEWVSRYSRSKGRGFYFIQHLEWTREESVRNLEGSAAEDRTLEMVGRGCPKPR